MIAKKACRQMIVSIAALSAFAPAGRASAAVSSAIVQAVYQADTRFPQYLPLWWEGWPWTDEHGEKVHYAHEGMPLGGYFHVYLRNTSDRPLEVSDVLLDGVSVVKTIAPEPGPDKVKPGDHYPSSIQFSKLGDAEIERVTAAGEPVWWKVDPAPVPAGGMAEVTIRLRRDPRPETLDVKVLAGSETFAQTVRVKELHPRIFSISFSAEMDKAFLYLRHPKGASITPQQILVDGKDLTDRSTILSDPAVETVPVIVRLPEPVREPEFHCFQAIYADGSPAMAGIRVWEPDFKYGMWGYPRPEDTPEQTARHFLDKMHRHNINVLMWSWGDPVAALAQTDEGQAFMRDLDIRLMHHIPGHFENLMYGFLMDEPDAADFGSKSINPPGKRLGSLGQCLVKKSRLWRRKEPHTLQLLNVNATFEPEQYYMYAQLPDVSCIDRYYAGELQGAYRSHPADLGAMTKPISIYAAGTVNQSAAAPKPMHLILMSSTCDQQTPRFRDPLPEEKRVEVYYALAAGTKGISYWWYTPFGECLGPGTGSPEMVALMTEIGLLGAEVRTVGPVVSRSCPAELPVKAPRLLWVRTLLAGDDAVAIIVVNDNIAFDQVGAAIKPLENARIHVQMPSWLEPADVFEITSEGTQEIQWQPGDSGISLDLGTVELTRMVIVTKDTALRGRLQRRYEAHFAANVRRLATRRP